MRSRWCAPPFTGTAASALASESVRVTPSRLHGSKSPLLQTTLDALEVADANAARPPKLVCAHDARGRTPHVV